MIILGIDPGQTGGFVVLKDDKEILYKEVVPTIGKEIDIHKVDDFLHYCINILKVDHIFLEKVHAFPGQGVSSVFKFGHTFGILQALATTKGARITLVPPATWCKVIHEGASTKMKPKEKSLLVLKRLFPNESLLATERSKKPHEGLMDALLIASYGFRILGK